MCGARACFFLVETERELGTLLQVALGDLVLNCSLLLFLIPDGTYARNLWRALKHGYKASSVV